MRSDQSAANENAGPKSGSRSDALESATLSAKGIPITDKDGNHNFQAIKGIGPVYAKRLKESGVTTFEHLSRLTSKELEGILGKLYKRFFSKEESIRAQAKEFARQKAQKN
jgi:predicted flap endonuclease-1-like 5' DNA nuclease